MKKSEFLAKFPEFSQTDECLIERHLVDAHAQLSPVAFGGLYDLAVGYLAAHQLCLSPTGQNSRLVAEDGTTTYFAHYKMIQARCVAGPRTT